MTAQDIYRERKVEQIQITYDFTFWQFV